MQLTIDGLARILCMGEYLDSAPTKTKDSSRKPSTATPPATDRNRSRPPSGRSSSPPPSSRRRPTRTRRVRSTPPRRPTIGGDPTATTSRSRRPGTPPSPPLETLPAGTSSGANRRPTATKTPASATTAAACRTTTRSRRPMTSCYLSRTTSPSTNFDEHRKRRTEREMETAVEDPRSRRRLSARSASVTPSPGRTTGAAARGATLTAAKPRRVADGRVLDDDERGPAGQSAVVHGRQRARLVARLPEVVLRPPATAAAAAAAPSAAHSGHHPGLRDPARRRPRHPDAAGRLHETAGRQGHRG